MPRRHQQTAPLALPYNFSLPGGSEMDALGTGFTLERARDEGHERGYSSAATESNQRLLKDTQNAYLVADLNDPHGRLARAMTQPDLYAQYKADLAIKMPGTSAKKLHHDIYRAMGIPRGQKVADGLPFQHTLSLRRGTVFVTHVAAAQARVKP